MRLASPLALLCLSATTALAAPQTPQQREELQALRSHLELLDGMPAVERGFAWQQRVYAANYHLAVKLGQIIEGEGSTYFQQKAISVLEELIFEAGEGSAMALHSYRALGDIYAQLDRWEEAAEFYRTVAVRLLGEPGDEPQRLTAVPYPTLEEELIEEPIEEEELPIEEDPTVTYPAALELELDHALRDWNQSGNVLEAQLRSVHLQTLAGQAAGTSAAPRANLVLGDYASSTEQHQQAALHYRAILEALTDPAPEERSSDPRDSSGE